MDQVEGRIIPHSVSRRIQRKSETLRVLIPILLIHVCNIHLDRTRQCLYHPFCRPIGLRPIGHRRLLFLSHDSAESVEEIRHKAGFTVVPDGFTGSKASEDTLFIILRDRLCCPRRPRFRDHVSREQIDPQEQLGVAFEGLRQRRDVVHGHDLEQVRSL
jgi:hypothetical protein